MSCLTAPDQGAAANAKFCEVLSSYRCSALNSRQQTPVAKRTVNPVYNPKDATFDFSIYLSLADQLGVLELIIWDKDMQEYLGEVALPLKDWFADKHSGKARAFGFDQPGNIVCYFKSLLVPYREFICP